MLNNIISKYITKYKAKDGYKYYREILSQFLNDKYNLPALYINVICSNLIPKDIDVHSFAINTYHNNIIMALWNTVINVDEEVNKYI